MSFNNQDDWVVMKLAEVSDIQFSNVDKNIIDNEKIVSLCNYVDVFKNEYIDANLPFSAGSATSHEIDKFTLNKGDVIFTKDSEDPLEIAVPALVVEKISNLVCGYHLGIARPNALIDGHYLMQSMQSDFCKRQLKKMANGVSRFGLGLNDIKGLKILVPPIHEQKKICAVFSDCDTAIASLIQEKQSTERALTFSRKEIFRPYVCGTDTEKQAEPIHKLGELFSERVETGNEKLPLVSITMGRGVIPREEVGRKDSSSDDKSKYRRICVGDIGYNTMRMWQGVNGLSSMDGIVSPAYTICIPNTEKIHPDWAAHLFKEKRMIFQFWRHSQGLVNDTLGLKFPAFAEIKIRTPNLQTQSNDVQHMAALYEHHSLLGTQIENLKKQKRGLMQQLLTGKLRVKGAA